MMTPQFAVRLFTLGRVPVLGHVSLLAGFLLAGGGLSFRPWAWLTLVFIVLLHELGHSVAIRAYRLSTTRVVLHGFGGECQFSGHTTPWQDAVIAWGGVVAQLLLLGAMSLGGSLGIWPAAFVRGEVFGVLTATNFLLVVVNLLPIRGLDGDGSSRWAICA